MSKKKRNIEEAYYDDTPPISGQKRQRDALMDEEVIDSMLLLKQFGVNVSGTSEGILIQSIDLGKLHHLLQTLAIIHECAV